MKDKEKIQMPPVLSPLYLPVEFWTKVVSYLDSRVQFHGELQRYVKLGIEISIQNGIVTHHKFNEEVTDKVLIRKAKKEEKK